MAVRQNLEGAGLGSSKAPAGSSPFAGVALMNADGSPVAALGGVVQQKEEE